MLPDKYIGYLSEEEFAALQEEIIPVIRIKNIRKIYGMTQKAFAELLNIKFNTLVSWEAGRKIPSSPGRAILYVAEKSPEFFLKDKDAIIKAVQKRAPRLP